MKKTENRFLLFFGECFYLAGKNVINSMRLFVQITKRGRKTCILVGSIGYLLKPSYFNCCFFKHISLFCWFYWDTFALHGAPT